LSSALSNTDRKMVRVVLFSLSTKIHCTNPSSILRDGLCKFANKSLNDLSKVYFYFLESTAAMIKRQTLNTNFFQRLPLPAETEEV
jgi:hypothetical protein